MRILQHELFVSMAAGVAGGLVALVALSPALVLVFGLLSFAAHAGRLLAQALF